MDSLAVIGMIIGIIMVTCFIFVRIWLRIFGIRQQNGWSPDQYKNQSELRENGCCLGKTLEIYDDTESNVPTHQRSQPGHYYSRAESLTSPGKSLLSPSWRKSQHSPTSHIFEYDSISSVSPKSPNLFLFPPSKPGLSSGSGNLLPSSRHSFRYNVHLPGTPSTKRRSLPEILLHFTQKPSRKSPASRRPSEFLVHVQDFDESEDFGSVGLKGSLGLPVCDESPEMLEVKPIVTSGSTGSFSRLLLFGLRKHETLI